MEKDFSQLSNNQIRAYEKAVTDIIDRECGYRCWRDDAPVGMGVALDMFANRDDGYSIRPKYINSSLNVFDKVMTIEYETQCTPIAAAKDMLQYVFDTISDDRSYEEKKVLELLEYGVKFKFMVHDRDKRQHLEFEY